MRFLAGEKGGVGNGYFLLISKLPNRKEMAMALKKIKVALIANCTLNP